MTESLIGVAEGTDKYLHTEARTIGGTAREEQIVHEGQPYLPTYTAWGDDLSTAVANDHLLAVMADGSNYTRLVRLSVVPTEDFPASDSTLKLNLVRLSTAPSGGGTATVVEHDANDSAYGGTAETLPSSKGTEGDILRTFYLDMASTATDQGRDRILWTPPRYSKPIVFGTATSDGIALKVIDTVASAAVVVHMEFVVTTYL
jgi:hypothetical protein